MTFDEISKGGEAWLGEAIAIEVQETLQLDFKGAAAGKPGAMFTAEGKLTKDGRRVLSEALSAFSNSAGGVIVIGVDCRRNADGIDCAQALDPVPNWKAALSSVNAAVGDLLQPKSDEIRVSGFGSYQDQSAGFLVIDVPRSERRPHMSQMTKHYLKRSGTGSFVMEHYDIEDAFRRGGVPDLEVSHTLVPVGRSVSVGNGMDAVVRLALTNHGLGTAKHISMFYRETGIPMKFGAAYKPSTNRLIEHGGKRLAAPENFMVNPGETNVFEDFGYTVRRVDDEYYIGSVEAFEAVFSLSYIFTAEDMRPKQGEIHVAGADFEQAASKWLFDS